MEAAVSNAIERDEVVLVGVNGLWGERFSDMADRHGTNINFIINHWKIVIIIIKIIQWFNIIHNYYH